MTAPEQPVEQRSRVKLTTTAKGDVTPEISVVSGETAEELERIRRLAVEAYDRTVSDLGIRVAGARG